jgi:hypothetical protein
LASLNNGHNSDLHACCVGMKSSSKPNLVPTKPLCARNTAWRSWLVTNLSSTALGRALAAEVEARTIVGRYRVSTMPLVCSLIRPCNSSGDKERRGETQKSLNAKPLLVFLNLTLFMTKLRY